MAEEKEKSTARQQLLVACGEDIDEAEKYARRNNVIAQGCVYLDGRTGKYYVVRGSVCNATNGVCVGEDGTLLYQALYGEYATYVREHVEFCSEVKAEDASSYKYRFTRVLDEKLLRTLEKDIEAADRVFEEEYEKRCAVYYHGKSGKYYMARGLVYNVTDCVSDDEMLMTFYQALYGDYATYVRENAEFHSEAAPENANGYKYRFTKLTDEEIPESITELIEAADRAFVGRYMKHGSIDGACGC